MDRLRVDLGALAIKRDYAPGIEPDALDRAAARFAAVSLPDEALLLIGLTAALIFVASGIRVSARMRRRRREAAAARIARRDARGDLAELRRARAARVAKVRRLLDDAD